MLMIKSIVALHPRMTHQLMWLLLLVILLQLMQQLVSNQQKQPQRWQKMHTSQSFPFHPLHRQFPHIRATMGNLEVHSLLGCIVCFISHHKEIYVVSWRNMYHD